MSLVEEYNETGKIHFIKRMKLRKQIYDETLLNVNSYDEFLSKCPIETQPYLYDIIGLCMKNGKEVSESAQNWYKAETQKRVAEMESSKTTVVHDNHGNTWTSHTF